MTNKKIWLGILAITLVFGMMVIGCDTGSNNSVPNTAKFEGIDSAGNTYTITITQNLAKAVYEGAVGDSYVLVIKFADGTEKTSTGVIKEINNVDGTLTLQPSVADAETFSVTISDGEVTSVDGTIAVNGGEVITPRTFETIYLRANRWVNPGNGDIGENWNTMTSIKLNDFSSEKFESGYAYKIKMSGSIDNKLEYGALEVHLHRNGEWIKYLSGGIGNNHKIGPGSFDVTISLHSFIEYVDLEENEDFVIGLANHLYHYNAETHILHFDRERIPANIPHGTIMATISNFDISLIKEPSGIIYYCSTCTLPLSSCECGADYGGLPNPLISNLQEFGFTDFIVPNGGTLHANSGVEDLEGARRFLIIWTDASEDMFDNYVSGWGAKLSESLVLNTDNDNHKIYLFPEGAVSLLFYKEQDIIAFQIFSFDEVYLKDNVYNNTYFYYLGIDNFLYPQFGNYANYYIVTRGVPNIGVKAEQLSWRNCSINDFNDYVTAWENELGVEPEEVMDTSDAIVYKFVLDEATIWIGFIKNTVSYSPIFDDIFVQEVSLYFIKNHMIFRVEEHNPAP